MSLHDDDGNSDDFLDDPVDEDLIKRDYDEDLDYLNSDDRGYDQEVFYQDEFDQCEHLDASSDLLSNESWGNTLSKAIFYVIMVFVGLAALKFVFGVLGLLF